MRPLSFHLNLLSSVCRVHVDRKLTSSAVMWARLHCSPLELSLQRLLMEIDSYYPSNLAFLSIWSRWAATATCQPITVCVSPVSVAWVWWPWIFLHQRYNDLFSHVCQQRERGVYDEVYEPCRRTTGNNNLCISAAKMQDGNTDRK